jgi:hypothetical protein
MFLHTFIFIFKYLAQSLCALASVGGLLCALTHVGELVCALPSVGEVLCALALVGGILCALALVGGLLWGLRFYGDCSLLISKEAFVLKIKNQVTERIFIRAYFLLTFYLLFTSLFNRAVFSLCLKKKSFV